MPEETEEDEEINDNICRQADNQADTNSKTEAHSNPLWIVGERANIENREELTAADVTENVNTGSP